MRSTHLQLRAFAPLILCATSSQLLAAHLSITGIGVLPGGVNSFSTALSDDGAVVVGYAHSPDGGRVVRWTRAGGIEPLPKSADALRGYGLGVSADGSRIVGYEELAFGTRAFSWTSSTGLQPYPFAAGGQFNEAWAISADGAVTVGACDSSDGALACRWTSSALPQTLAPVPDAFWSRARAVSADGQVVAGEAATDMVVGRSFRWTPQSGTQLLDLLPDGTSSDARSISRDGSVIVGSCLNTQGLLRAVFWNDSGIHDLGLLQGDYLAVATATNADGSIIAGGSSSSTGGRAFWWTPNLGMVDLNVYLASLGLDLTGWRLLTVSAMTPDGSTITGSGVFNGVSQAFVITGIPTPASATALLIAGTASCVRRRRPAGA